MSPSLYGRIVTAMKTAGLAGPDDRIVLEKPVGRDLESFREIDDAVADAFDERQVFRIDHYLGKETVQNLIALRFGNAIFEPLWNNLTIDHVQITVGETVGVGDRWPYYDEYGACGTWCRTICCNCCVWWRWNRPATWTPTPCAMRR